MRPFVMGNPKGLVHVGGQRMTMAEAQRSPERLPFDLAPHERGKTADELWAHAIADIKALLDRDGPSAWEEIRAQFDQFSLYDFLSTAGSREGAIEYYAVMNFVETDMNNAVMEVLREDLEGAYVDMQTIDGGMDQLPNAFYRGAAAGGPVRRGGARHRADRRRRDGPLQDGSGPLQRHRRLLRLRAAVPVPADDRARPAVLAREERAIRAAQLPRVDQGPVPGPPPLLGAGGRHRRRRRP